MFLKKSLAVVVAAITVLTGSPALASSEEGVSMDTISGEVWYRERMVLPPGSELLIRLEDVAKMDVAAEMVAELRQPLEGGPPYAFELEFDPARLNDRGRYAIRARIENGGQLLFINTQQIPAFGGREGEPLRVMVSRVGGNKAQRSAPPAPPDAELKNTYWKLITLDGQKVGLGAGKREVQMVLTIEDRARGFSGCNKFSGGFTTESDQLHFEPLMSTRRACIEGMELETAFLSTLHKVSYFDIEGETLTLMDGERTPLMQFVSVYL